MIDRKSCDYKPRNERTKKGKINQRARRIEWEHVMPAENFGRHFSCWRDGDSKCISNKGKSFKGRRCCQKISKQYRIIQADMMNLVPAIGELNADRSNFRYGISEPIIGQYGKVSFQVDFKQRRAYINPSKRGDIARIYLYMNKTYNIPLSKQESKMMKVWNEEDPVDKWEKVRKIKIFEYMKEQSN
ncbi:MAG: deoxyribonuclease [Arcobacter sp.]|nr:MAG: deoxyribonuclease [Arcobacter sp.]